MTKAPERIDIWAQSLCRELRQQSYLVPYAVMMKAIQEAGTSTALTPAPVAVKPLEWEYCELELTYTADHYRVYECKPVAGENLTWVCEFGPTKRNWHSSEAEAKAAAQADYERRILSALTGAP